MSSDPDSIFKMRSDPVLGTRSDPDPVLEMRSDPVFEMRSDPDPVFEMRSDPDPVFKIFLDPDPGFKAWSDPIYTSRLKIHLNLTFSCSIYWPKVMIQYENIKNVD